MLTRLQHQPCNAKGHNMAIKKRALKEKEIEHQILTYLNSLPCCFAFKVVTSGFYDSKRRIFRKNRSPFVIAGTSDIIGICKGRFFCIEVKSELALKRELKNPSEHFKRQRKFLDIVTRMGGTGIFASHVGQVREAMDISAY